jgi:hypothetical protein
MVPGSKGQLILDMNRELKEKLRDAESQRDKLEMVFNHAQYELRHKND